MANAPALPRAGDGGMQVQPLRSGRRGRLLLAGSDESRRSLDHGGGFDDTLGMNRKQGECLAEVASCHGCDLAQLSNISLGIAPELPIPVLLRCGEG